MDNLDNYLRCNPKDRFYTMLLKLLDNFDKISLTDILQNFNLCDLSPVDLVCFIHCDKDFKTYIQKYYDTPDFV